MLRERSLFNQCGIGDNKRAVDVQIINYNLTYANQMILFDLLGLK